MRSEILHGVIQGSAIHLDTPSRLPEGMHVRVIVTPKLASDDEVKLPPGEGLRRSAGAWRGDDEEGLEDYLRSLRQ